MDKTNSEEQRGPDDKIIAIETVKESWSKTYITEDKPDWSHILPYYELMKETIDYLQMMYRK